MDKFFVVKVQGSKHVKKRLNTGKNEQPKPSKVELDINKRWEEGIDHHPKSVALFKKLADIDFRLGGDFFGWKSGGDGDNGEHLMYEMDIIFETEDEIKIEKKST